MARVKVFGLTPVGWLVNLGLSLAIAMVLVMFVLEPVRVEGNSMLPRLSNDERLFVNRFLFNFEPVHRGDVVVFHYPRDVRQNFIKRVVGLPGEQVQIESGTVYIDGHQLYEPYVPPEYRDYRSYPMVTVGAGEYFVMGDHRNSSNDSRAWGCLGQEYIFGKAVFAYWPMDDLGLVH